MARHASEDRLTGLIAELGRMAPIYREEILDSLDATHAQRVAAMLSKGFTQDDGGNALSPWLRRRINDPDTNGLKPRVADTLQTAAALLAGGATPRRPSLFGRLREIAR